MTKRDGDYDDGRRTKAGDTAERKDMIGKANIMPFFAFWEW